jgi:hypothetical protein
VINDIFDSTLLSVDTASVTFTGPVVAMPTTLPLASIIGNTMTLASLPVLQANQTVTVYYNGAIIAYNGSLGTNTGTIYVGGPETDPLENSVFVDNKDKVSI